MQSLHLQDAILIIYVSIVLYFYMPFYKNDIIATRSIHYTSKVSISFMAEYLYTQ